MSTDCGVEGLIINIRQSPSDDSRKRLFELAATNSRTYFTASQARARNTLALILPLNFNMRVFMFVSNFQRILHYIHIPDGACSCAQVAFSVPC